MPGEELQPTQPIKISYEDCDDNEWINKLEPMLGIPKYTIAPNHRDETGDTTAIYILPPQHDKHNEEEDVVITIIRNRELHERLFRVDIRTREQGMERDFYHPGISTLMASSGRYPLN